MKKVIFSGLALLIFVPSISFAAPLTQVQAISLISVVQSSPKTPASAFTSLITAFSKITSAQAESLVAVVKGAPGVAPNSFVNLLIAFTQDSQPQNQSQPSIPLQNTATTSTASLPARPIQVPPTVIPPVTAPPAVVPPVTVPPVTAAHTNVLTEDFNGYSNGSLVGQGGWYDRANGAQYMVEDTVVKEGEKALYNNNTGADSVITKKGASALANGKESFYIQTRDSSNWGDYNRGENVQMGVFQGSWDGPSRALLAFMKDGHVAYIDPRVDRYVSFDTYQDNAWNLVNIEWRKSDASARYRVNSGSWSEWIPVVGSSSFTGFDTVGFVTFKLGTGGVYIDDLH